MRARSSYSAIFCHILPYSAISCSRNPTPQVYAFGVLLLELFSGVSLASQLPRDNLRVYFKKRKEELADQNDRAFESKDMDEQCEPTLLPITNRCCAFSPLKRPVMLEVLTFLRVAKARMGENDAKGEEKSTTETVKSETEVAVQVDESKVKGVQNDPSHAIGWSMASLDGKETQHRRTTHSSELKRTDSPVSVGSMNGIELEQQQFV